MNGEAQEIGFQGIKKIVEIGAPTQEIKDKVDRPKNDVVPCGDFKP